MSRVKSGVFERSEFPVLQRNLDFLLLRNLLSKELFFTFLLSKKMSMYYIRKIILFLDI